LIALADQGAIVAAPERIENDAIRARSPLLGDVELPIENVAAVVLRLPADHLAADGLVSQLQRLATETDAVLLSNGDELTGTLERLDRESLVLKTDIGDVTVERGQLQGVGFDASLAVKPSTAAAAMLVGFRDGSLIRTQDLTIADGRVQLLVPGGAARTAPAGELVFVQALGGPVQYLSDMEVAEFRHLPFLTESWSYGRDHNVTGARLRSGRQLYEKGLGVHSAANLSYRLDGAYRRFEAEVALDDHVGTGGSVTFRVYVDGEQRFDSGLVRGGDTPRPVTVDLRGAKLLSLIVGYGERGDVLDRANWLDARLVK
jgi:hypothetical protein